MKKIYLLLIGLCLIIHLKAQVSKTMEVTSGKLSSILTNEEKNTLASLTLIGTVDARDFITTTQMPLLTALDLSQTKVTAIDTVFDDRIAISRADTIGGYDYFPRSARSPFSELLTSFKLPSTLKAIDVSGLKDCRGLTTLEIPPTVTSIGTYAFCDCKALTSIYIPSSVSHIEDYAFFGCSGLKELAIFASVGGISRYTFTGCSSLTTITIPSPIVYIDEFAFASCTGITTVILNQSFKGFEDGVFINCPNISSIYSYNPVPPGFAAAVFDAAVYNDTLFVPYGSGSLYATAEGWKDFKNIIEILPFTLSSKALSIEAVPVVQSIQITSDGAWTTMCDKEWLTVSPTSGYSSQTVTFTCKENTAFEPRIATVTFSDGKGYSQTVYLTQKARTNSIPIANAGGDQIVVEGELVQLDGAASNDADGDPLTYQWTVPEGITLIMGDDAHPSFMVPKVEKDTIYTFNLVVNDGKVNSSPDQVFIAVQNKIIELGLSADSIVFESTDSSANIFIMGNAQWSISTGEDWLTVTPVSGVGQKEINIIALANEAQTDRIAHLTISAPEVDTKTVTVIQHGLITRLDKITRANVISCYPNPFIKNMTIEITNPSNKEVTVEIYSISGLKIKTLARGLKGAKISLSWDGNDTSGRKVAPGVYLLKVNGEVRKVVRR